LRCRGGPWRKKGFAVAPEADGTRTGPGPELTGDCLKARGRAQSPGLAHAQPRPNTAGSASGAGPPPRHDMRNPSTTPKVPPPTSSNSGPASLTWLSARSRRPTALGTVLLLLPPQADSASSQIMRRATAGRDTSPYITSAPEEFAIRMAVSYAYLGRRPGLRAADRADRTRRHQAGVTKNPLMREVDTSAS
jgi:hypothetical protein